MSGQKTKLLFFTVVFTFSFLLITWNRALTEAYWNYMGWKPCAQCHEVIAKNWAATKHAKAFDSLKKSGQENVPGCVKCHVTGYEKDGGFIDYELTPEMVGIQCEECHGEGKKHVTEGGSAKTIRRSADSDMCRRCHTPSQDRNFDYQKKIGLVHGVGNGGKYMEGR